MRDVLIVIDVQADYCTPEGVLGKMGRDMTPTMAMIERLKPFLAKARQLGVPVIAVRSETPTLCRPGSPGAALCYPLDPTDRVVTKHTYSAFGSPEFKAILADLAPERLVVAGVDTHICVEGTVRHAHDLGYQVDLLQDLVATRGENREFHENSVKVMGKYFGRLITSEDALARWQHAADL